MIKYLTLVVVSLSVLQFSLADPATEDRASFSSSSRGLSRVGTLQFEHAFEQAFAVAIAEKDAVFTIERLLQRVIQEPEIDAALTASDVDTQKLAAELDLYLQKLDKTDSVAYPVSDPKLTTILRNIVARRHFAGESRAMSSFDVLAEVIRHGESMAADRLMAYGLTAEKAADLADADHAATLAEDDAELERTEARLAILSSQPPQGINDPAEGDYASRKFAGVKARDYRMVVVSRDPEAEVKFKAAISADGSLRLLVEETPFDTRIYASEVIALIESVNARGGVSASLFAILSDGTQTKIGGFAGESGAIFEHRKELGTQWESGLLR